MWHARALPACTLVPRSSYDKLYHRVCAFVYASACLACLCLRLMSHACALKLTLDPTPTCSASTQGRHRKLLDNGEELLYLSVRILKQGYAALKEKARC